MYTMQKHVALDILPDGQSFVAIVPHEWNAPQSKRHLMRGIGGLTMRDRLIELVKPFVSGSACEHESGSCELTNCRSCNARSLANHLLSNGVIVPPVGIGDSIWSIHYNRPREWKVIYLGFNGEEWHINVHWSDKDHFVTKEVDGKYFDRMFFRTKEEAERALKGGEQV